MAVVAEELRVDSITEVREGQVAALHARRLVARPTKLPLGLEMLEEILQEV
jgi:hypothetical protein